MKQLKNKITIISVVVITTLTLAANVNAVELKKKDLWEGIYYGGFKTYLNSKAQQYTEIQFGKNVRENGYNDILIDTLHYPITNTDGSIDYGYYLYGNIQIFKNEKLAKAYAKYEKGEIKLNKTVKESFNNCFDLYVNGHFDKDNNIVLNFTLETVLGSIPGFEDITVGLSDNGKFIGNLIKTEYKPVTDGYSDTYNGSNYNTEFTLKLPADYIDKDLKNIHIYLSNNYMPGSYFSFKKPFELLYKTYGNYQKEKNTNEPKIAKWKAKEAYWAPIHRKLKNDYKATVSTFDNCTYFETKKYALNSGEVRSVMANNQAVLTARGELSGNNFDLRINTYEGASIRNQNPSLLLKQLWFTDGKTVLKFSDSYFGNVADVTVTYGANLYCNKIDIVDIEEIAALYNLLKNSENITVRLIGANTYYEHKLGKKQRLGLLDVMQPMKDYYDTLK